jgi:hypothetical protein
LSFGVRGCRVGSDVLYVFTKEFFICCHYDTVIVLVALYAALYASVLFPLVAPGSPPNTKLAACVPAPAKPLLPVANEAEAVVQAVPLYNSVAVVPGGTLPPAAKAAV